MEEHPEYIKHSELAKKLNVSTKTFEKVWRDWPHIFVGSGTNLKSARFNYQEVIDYLKKQPS